MQVQFVFFESRVLIKEFIKRFYEADIPEAEGGLGVVLVDHRADVVVRLC